MRNVLAHVRAQWAGFLALFLVIAGGTAYAADTIGSSDIIDESILTQDIKDRQVKSGDLANNAVHSNKVANQSLTSDDVDAGSFNLSTGTGAVFSCGDDDETGTACVSTTVNMEEIGPITIHATGTWDTFKFDDVSGANSSSDNPDLVQGKCNLRFDGIQVGPVQELGEADASGTGIPTHPAGAEGTVALTARTIPLGGSGIHTLDLFCKETDGDIDFHNLDITAQGSIG